MDRRMYVTGPMYGIKDRLLNPYYPYNQDLKEGDILFQLGNFGFIEFDSEKERNFLDYIAENMPYTIAFIDGNNENYTLLNHYPVENWKGGKVHVIRRDSMGHPKIIHLMRGQVFSIYGKKIYTLGGTDHEDSISKLKGGSINGPEVPNSNEICEGINNIYKHGRMVDYILTYYVPSESLYIFYPERKDRSLGNCLDNLREVAMYKHWYIGCINNDCDIWRNQSVLLFDVRNMITGENLPYDLSLWGKEDGYE